MSTIIGMLVADRVGIMAGVVLCKRITQLKIECFSAIIFVLFGLIGVHEVCQLR